MDDYAVVLPTIRPEEAVKRIKESSIPAEKFIIVEDANELSYWPDGIEAYCRADFPPDIFTAYNSGVRCFGFLKAYDRGVNFILTFDDDVAFDIFLVQDHLKILTSSFDVQRWMSTANIRTRGLPWRMTGQSVIPALSHGLWTNIPDFDAPTQLMLEDTVSDVEPFDGIIPKGLYYPMCWMNLAFQRDVVPLMYAPFNGPSFPYDRFEDIWTGIISKRIMDHLGMYVHSGQPTVRHDRLSDVFTNLQKEASGIAYNETFWQLIDSIELVGTSPATCMMDIADAFDDTDDEYLYLVSTGIRNWLALL